MREFFESKFNSPILSSEQELKEEEQKINNEKPETSRREFLKKCGLAAAGLFFGQLLKAEKVLSQIESGEIKVKNGINYASLETQEKLKDFERFFVALDLDKAPTPIIVGTGDDYWRGLSEDARALTRATEEATGREIAAFAFTGGYINDKSPGLAKKLDVKSTYVYMIFNTDNSNFKQTARYFIHESLHAKHFANRLKDHPNDKSGYRRYEKLSEDVNSYFEEIITNAETLEFFQEQLNNSDKSILTDKEKKVTPQMIESEKEYFLDNYARYYLVKYPRDKFPMFNIPHGEFKVKDPMDKKVEEWYKKYNIIETLSRQAKSME